MSSYTQDDTNAKEVVMDDKSVTTFEGRPENVPEGMPGGTQSVWVKVRKVLKCLLEVIGFLAAIKTLLT